MSSHWRPTILFVILFSIAPAAQRRAADPAALAAEGAEALKERRFGDALEAFTSAAKLAPREVTLWYGAGLAAYMLGQNADAEASLQRALKLNPRFIDAAAVLGDLQYRGGRVKDAIATYESALQFAPEEPRLIERLEEWKRDTQLSDRFYEARGAHFSVRFEGPADEALARRAVEMLEAHYWRVGTALTAYPPDVITVVLYTQQQFRDVTRAPQWAAGVYDGRIRLPVRGALEHPAELDRILAHEFVHAVVATLGGRNVPVWLNEGLAMAFEPGGVEEAAAILAGSSARPALRQLHGSFTRFAGDDVPAAYAQSAVAVRRMLDMRGAAAVVALLQDLGSGRQFAPAFHQRLSMSYDDFQRMVVTH